MWIGAQSTALFAASSCDHATHLAMAPVIFILNGPNLNRLGSREPDIYGHATLDDIHQACVERAAAFDHTVEFRQTNHEGELVEQVHEAVDRGCAIVINPAAYGHTSIALHDALKLASTPIIEVHLSNPSARETFRASSMISSLARGVISGFGPMSYVLGVEAACRLAPSPSPAKE